jgi:hypothetical protein
VGGSHWSDEHYTARSSLRAKAGIAAFAFSEETERKPVAERKAHVTLEPKGIKVRESRDSEAHPNSNAVIFAFDDTGSMHRFPRTAQKQLPSLMGLLLRKGYLPDPQICVCAFGDYTCDTVPLQLGQFESGIEIEDCLTNLFLEGGGGTEMSESPELILYFAVRKTALDCFEKRGRKGYLFIVTDEMGRSLSPDTVRDVFGEGGQEKVLTMKELLIEAQKMYEIFVVTPGGTSNLGNERLESFWRELVGQHYIRLNDPEAICELVAATIGLCEKNVDRAALVGDLAETGLSKSGVDAITTALAKPGTTATEGVVAKVPAGSGLASV